MHTLHAVRFMQILDVVIFMHILYAVILIHELDAVIFMQILYHVILMHILDAVLSMHVLNAVIFIKIWDAVIFMRPEKGACGRYNKNDPNDGSGLHMFHYVYDDVVMLTEPLGSACDDLARPGTT